MVELVVRTVVFGLCVRSRVFHHRKYHFTSATPLENPLQPGHVGAAAGRGGGSEKQHDGLG